MGVERLQIESLRPALESVDRELAFFRRRAGQVFFLSLLVEVLILGGKESISIRFLRAWVEPLMYSGLFVAVATVGIALGTEYRRRIHILKESRLALLRSIGGSVRFPRIGGVRLSEIEVLYVVLVFLSSAGIILVWLNGMAWDDDLPYLFWVFFIPFVVAGAGGLCWAARKLAGWLLPIAKES